MTEGRRAPLWSLPHLLTLSRLPLSVALWLVRRSTPAFVAVFLVSAFTDLVDGPLARGMARRRRARGEATGGLGEAGGIGAWLDPACDKTLVTTAVAAIVDVHRPPWIWVGLVGLRELWLLGVGAIGLARWGVNWEGYDFRAGLWGKLTLAAQGLAVLGLLLHWPFRMAFAGVAGGLGLIAGMDYGRRMWRHRPGPPPVR